MTVSTRRFSKDELNEVFPANPIREVDFEIRFTPRLRINAEMWRFQEDLVDDYPDVGLESAILPTGSTLNITVFQNQRKARLIKVSPQNMALAFSSYSNFEEFKDEIQKRTASFCGTFDVTSLTRVGLRYVNEIPCPTQQSDSLTRLVRPLMDFSRIRLDSVQQFAMQVTTSHEDHMILLRTAMLPGPIRTYVLDIDAYTEAVRPTSDVMPLIERFHDAAQRTFLDHITDEYKEVMRGRR
jgi:uncharacterized protein (TIGR04255 family)